MSLCLVVLLVAVGAYSYVTISRLNNHMSDLESQVDSLQNTVSSLEDERDSLQNHVSTLESQVDELQDEIDSLKKPINSTEGTRTFVFEWSPEQQNIVNGTLRMELTFAWKEGENLSIIAKVNDDEYNAHETFADYLGIVFDLDNDGLLEGESALAAFVDNTTKPAALGSEGYLEFILWEKMPSPYHTCVFEPSLGYTFNISLSLTKFGISSDLVHVCYNDLANGYVYVRFHFGLPLEVY